MTDHPPAATAPTVPSPPKAKSPLRVLLVEDEPGDSMLAEVALQRLNPPASIMRAGTLAQALDFAGKGHPFDIALVDLSLPDSFGMPTVTAIHDAFPRVPIIVLTGLDDTTMEDRIVGTAAQDYLIKGSFRGDALARAIRHAMTRNRLERQLEESELRNRTLVELAPDAILVIAPGGTIQSSNPAAHRMFGCDCAETRMEGCALAAFLPDAPDLLSRTPPGGNLRQDGTALRRGEPFPVAMAAAAMGNGSKMLLVSDMTERALLTQRLQEMARTDPLTGLANRRAFAEAAELEFHRFHRTGLPASMLMIDIDHFKRVNDLYGHQAGDEALVRLSKVLTLNSRATDTSVRFGGEEFILLMSGTEIGGGRDMAERVRDEVAKIRVESPQGSFGFTVSIGVASFAPDDASWQDTLRRADDGLYQAKSEGRNRVAAVHTLCAPPVTLQEK